MNATTEQATLPPSALQQRNRKVGLMALGFAAAMLGLGYASAPLYRLFCQVTGFGGTPQRASEAEAGAVGVTGKTISVRFDGNVERGMPWQFAPEQVTQQLKLGERKLAFYKARNMATRPVTGMATFNVEPAAAGKYFTKVHCFCFDQQTLRAGQEVDMPVQYYVDPAILKDPDIGKVEQITLSYTFHLVTDQAANTLDRTDPAG